MSSTIRDQERINARLLETTKKRGERDIKQIEAGHQVYKADLKKAHQAEIVDLQDNNAREVAQKADKKEKVLEEMRNHLHQTQEMTDKELQELKVNAARARQDEHAKLGVAREQMMEENSLYLEDLNYRHNTQAQKINADGKARVEQTKESMHELKTQTEEELQKKIDFQTDTFVTRYNNDGKTYQKIKYDQDNQFKKERLATNYRQQVEMGKLTDTHNVTLEKRDNEFRRGLKEQDLMFEKKFGETLARHNEGFKGLNDLQQKVLIELKNELNQEITQKVNKADDPFYKFTELKPTLAEFPDRVEIKIKVPDHAKADMRLTTNNKEAILTFTRRYTDASNTSPGVHSKINKAESFTTRLTTTAILEPKSIKQSYNDGVMTYVIKKV